MRLWKKGGGGPGILETTALYKAGVGESFATRMEIDFFKFWNSFYYVHSI
jgi:hypothetical protein